MPLQKVLGLISSMNSPYSALPIARAACHSRRPIHDLSLSAARNLICESFKNEQNLPAAVLLLRLPRLVRLLVRGFALQSGC